mgnify:CR=1 FL=1
MGKTSVKGNLTPKKTREWAGKIQGVVCLFLILCGMSLCIESVLKIYLPWQARILAVAVLALASPLMQLGWKWTLAGTFLFTGVLAIVCVKYQGILLLGMKELSNKVIELVNSYYRTEYLLWYLGDGQRYGWAAVLLIFVLLGFLQCLLAVYTRNWKYRLLAAAVIPVLLVTAGLMLGRAASFAGIVLAFLGLLLGALDLRERGSLLLGGAVALSVGLSVLLAGNGKLWGQVELLHEDWQAWQLNFEDQMLALVEKISHINLFSQQELKSYKLKNEEPQFDGREVFQITVDYPVSNPLYIRGFVGGEYENGTWKRISRQEFSDWAQAQGSDEQTYARLVQSYPYEYLSFGRKAFNTVKDKHVSIKLSQAQKGYKLMPYFTKISDQEQIRADVIYPPAIEKQFKWESFLGLTDYETQFMYYVTDPDMSEKEEFFLNYSNTYVQDVYTRLPEEGLEKLRAYAKESRAKQKTYEERRDEIQRKLNATGKTVWDISEMEEILGEDGMQALSMDEWQYDIENIRQMLWRDNWYSFDLEEVPQGEDSVEYFLFGQHKGYCTHFATAAALLFRLYDVPARFANGYLVMPSDFKRNDDGTWTASVTDERAHAWAEVFHDNIGFIPFEATPPAYIEMLDEMEKEEPLSAAVQKQDVQEQTRRQDALQKEQEEQKKKQEEERLRQEQERLKQEQESRREQEQRNQMQSGQNFRDTSWLDAKFRRLSLVSLSVTAVLALIWLILWQRKRWVLKDRQRRISQKERTQAVREISREMGKILNLLGAKRPLHMDDRSYCAFLKRQQPRSDWGQLFAIFQKAAFSEDGVTEEEYEETLAAYESLEQQLRSQGGIRGWYLKIYP